MTDLAADWESAVVPSEPVADVVRPWRSVRTSVFSVILSLSLAVVLTVPSSEFRAKGFRLGLMAKSWSHARS